MNLMTLCNCKNEEDCAANSDAGDEWCRVDYNKGVFASENPKPFVFDECARGCGTQVKENDRGICLNCRDQQAVSGSGYPGN